MSHRTGENDCVGESQLISLIPQSLGHRSGTDDQQFSAVACGNHPLKRGDKNIHTGPSFSNPPTTTSDCTWTYSDANNDGQVTFVFDLFKMFVNTGGAGFPFFSDPDPGYQVDTQGNAPSIPDGRVTFFADIFSAFQATIAGGGESWDGPICTAECPNPP